MADPTPGENPTPAATPPADPTANPAGPNGEEKRFTQADLEHQINERLTRERTAAATKAQKDKDAADAEALKVQAKWQELATQHEAKVKDLEPQLEALTAERDKLREHLANVVAAETKDWPKEVTDLLPATDDVLVRFEAVSRTRALAARLTGTTPVQGAGPGPKPAGAAGTVTDKDIIEQKRGSPMYTPY